MQVSSYLFQSPYPQAVQTGRPDPVQEQKIAAEEQAAKSKTEEANKQNLQSKDNASGLSAKSSTGYQNDNSSKETIQAVNAFIDAAKDVNRTQYLDVYANS